MDSQDLIIVGLGNPGDKYAGTRHNVGFLALEKISQTFQKIITEKKEKGVAYFLFEIGKSNTLALKPLNRMNKSGEALKKFLSYKNISQEEFIKKAILICDDSDLKEGQIKIIKDRGAGGHKGIENIFNNFHSTDFIRIKIGIRPPHNESPSESFVLSTFKKNGAIGKAIQKTPEIIECLIKKGIGPCQSLYNSKPSVSKTTYEP
jgi:peptidyl-tRNA hydrolase, PTH1 family